MTYFLKAYKHRRLWKPLNRPVKHNKRARKLIKKHKKKINWIIWFSDHSAQQRWTLSLQHNVFVLALVIFIAHDDELFEQGKFRSISMANLSWTKNRRKTMKFARLEAVYKAEMWTSAEEQLYMLVPFTAAIFGVILTACLLLRI